MGAGRPQVLVPVEIRLPSALRSYPLRELQPLVLVPDLGPDLAETANSPKKQLFLVRAAGSLHFYLGHGRRPSSKLAQLQVGNHLPLVMAACARLSYRLTRKLLTTTDAEPGWFELESQEQLQPILEIIWYYKYRRSSRSRRGLDRRMQRAIRKRRLATIRRLASRLEPRPIWYEVLVRTGDPVYVLEIFALLRLEQTRSAKMSVGKALRLEAAFRADLEYLLEAARRAQQPAVVAALRERHGGFLNKA